MPLSVTLTLAVTGSAESKTCWLHFLPISATDQDEIQGGVEAIQVKQIYV